MKFHIVDCFAEAKYQGNQLLVIRADRAVSDEEQQRIAREINFSETAFILSGRRDNGGYDVRIWTPNVGEVPFAGHPVLGTAHVIRHALEKGGRDVVRLNLKVGQIPVFAAEHGQTMRQNPPVFGVTIPAEEIAAVFGLAAGDLMAEFPVQWASTGLAAVMVPLRSREALARIRRDRKRFTEYVARRPECFCNHLFFVRTGESAFSARCLMEDFVEDPATGSANGCLAAYLVKHGALGKSEVACVVRQGEDMGRPSVLHIRAALIGGEWTIEVGGDCRMVAAGDWE